MVYAPVAQVLCQHCILFYHPIEKIHLGCTYLCTVESSDVLILSSEGHLHISDMPVPMLRCLVYQGKDVYKGREKEKERSNKGKFCQSISFEDLGVCIHGLSLGKHLARRCANLATLEVLDL